MATKKSTAMEELLAALGSNPTYTAKTAEQLQQQAANEKQSYYDRLRLATEQAHARNDLALQQQRDSLQATYDKQREASAEQYRQAYSQADREILRRGMQRSSYGIQTLANVNQAGAKAQQQLYDQQGAAEGNIDAQRALLAQQLGDQLLQYDAAQLADTQARYDELEQREYDRQLNATDRQNALAQQIYQYKVQEQQNAQNQANWEAQLQYQKDADAQKQANWQAEFSQSQSEFAQNQANWEAQMQYQKDADAQKQANWQSEFAQNQANWEAQMQYQKDADAQKQANWQAEFDESVRQYNKAHTGSGSGSAGGNSSKTPSAANNQPQNTWDSFMGSLFGDNTWLNSALSGAVASANSGVTGPTQTKKGKTAGTKQFSAKAMK